eukprot:TRINITY_DN32211_c0_g1_i1.p1 TRINITY_DN32211_c0_g1~~TRINITY_DN32211_c0_g1_i1.p1  ORF type:complete len:341 (+),score=37.75 TRINITY_DN32211_c0_g1_i1:115-1137(+)
MLPRSVSAPGLDATESPFSRVRGNSDYQSARTQHLWRHQEDTLGGETFHQQLQKSLGERSRGGPREHVRSFPHRLRNTRACEILHSSMHDPLASYKTLERAMPRLKSSQHRYHLLDGYKVFDQDTICMSTRDQLLKTKNGLLRTSTGSATFSDTHRKKVQLDVQELVRILAHEGWPGGGHGWTPKKLERIFIERTGRPGSWAHYEVPFLEFLSLFPKTFVFFNHRQFIKLAQGRNHAVLDEGDEAMIRLSMARTHGHVDTMHEVEGPNKRQPFVEEELRTHRMKATFSHRFQPVMDMGEEGSDRAHGRYKGEFRMVYQPPPGGADGEGPDALDAAMSSTF